MHQYPGQEEGRARRTAIILGTAVSMALAAGLIVAGGHLQRDPQAALSEGNRLFRQGQVEAAVAIYLEGYSTTAPNPTLLYNLGTALHHLERLPEAILWYRRAIASGDPSSSGRAGDPSRRGRASDPWLQDNLWLARRGLGSRTMQPGGPVSWLSRHTEGVRLAGIALSWIALLLVVAQEKLPARALVAAAALAISVYGTAEAVERWGPQPAVVLEDCLTPAGELPAGTETWVRPASGGWLISGSGDLVCPPAAIELVFPM